MTKMTVLAASALAFAGGNAQAYQGRYVLSYAHSDRGEQIDAFRQRYDLRDFSTTPGGYQLQLGFSLLQEARLDVGDASLLRGRGFGELRAQDWRVHGQFVPWQSTTPGPDAARERNFQLGFDFTRAGVPHLQTNFTRRDRETALGRSHLEDFRSEFSQSIDNYGYHLSFRNLESRSAGADPALAQTREWRGGLRGLWNLRSFSSQASYEGLLNAYRRRERRRDLLTHRVNVDANLRVGSKLSLGGAALGRWGNYEDNDVTGRRDIREETLSLRAGYRPGLGFDFRAAREIRRRRIASGDVVADFLRFEGLFRRPLRRQLTFQTGFLRSVDLRSDLDEIPSSSVYGFVDGKVVHGLDARAELRASEAGGSRSTGTQWRRLFELRARPRRSTHVEMTWRRDTLPEIAGIAQLDREWRLTGGYEPTSRIALLGSFRSLDGNGRIDREEQELAFNSTLRVAERSTLGFAWSRRTTELSTTRGEQRSASVDMTTWLPGEFKLQTSWNEHTGSSFDGGHTWSATLTKSF